MTSIEAVQITGGASANTIDASAYSGQSTLNGGGGNDILIGGTGVDFMAGGTGADIFKFTVLPTSLTATTADHITDFTSSQNDSIQISRAALGVASTTKVSFTATSTTQSLTQALSTSSLIVLDTATGNLWYNRDGAAFTGGSGAGTGGILAVLDKTNGVVPTIAASNITFI